MKKDKGVHVTNKDFKNNLLHREYQLYNNRIALRDSISGYGEYAKDFAVQYDKKISSVLCGCKASRPKHNYKARYVITTPSSYSSRNHLDVGVGSVKKLRRRRIRKIYLPETIEMGVGSADLTQYFSARHNRQQIYDHYNQKKTSSKCVGGIVESSSGCVVSEKLPPIAPSIIFDYTSRSRNRSDIRKRAKILRNIEIGSNSIHNLASESIQVDKSKHEFKAAYAGNSFVNQLVAATTQVEVETKLESKSKSSIRRTPMKAALAHQTEESNTPSLCKASKVLQSSNFTKASKTSSKVPAEVRMEKIFSTDAILRIHNLEIHSEAKIFQPTEPPDKINEDNSLIVSREKQNKKSNIEEDVSNISKESTANNISELKSTSFLKRRFDALRRTLCKKDDSKKVVKTPSIHTSTSLLAPISSSSRDNSSSHHMAVSKMSSQKIPSHHAPVLKTSSQLTPSRHTPNSGTSSRKSQQSRMDVAIASDPPSLVARSYSELFMGSSKATYSKHSSNKSITERKASSHDASAKYNTLDSNLNQGVKGMFELWGNKFNLEGNPEVEGIYSPSYIKSQTKIKAIKETPAPKAKASNKKRFFFFRSQPKETKKSKEKEKIQFDENFTTNRDITTERCEVKSGFAIKLGGQCKQNPIIVNKDGSKKMRESPKSPGKSLRQDWLMKFSTNPNESCYSVKLRWNNGKYLTSSSTVGAIEKAYNTAEFLKSASELSITPHRRGHFVPKIQHNINYMQLYQAWMIPRFERTILPSRSENYEDNIDVAFFDKQWFIDKSKACAEQLKLILHTKNISKVNRKVTSEYITIDIPKDFFSDSSTGDSTPTHPIRLSEEQVYNIVEYETPNASEVMKIYKNTTPKVDHSAQVSLVTESMETTIKPLQKDHKDQSKYQNKQTQSRQFFYPNNAYQVRKDLRNSRKQTVRCMEWESNHCYEICPSGRKCEYAECYSQEYCSENICTGPGNNWVRMDLFSWCISDHKLNYCSFNDFRKSFINEDCTKSCPNIHGEFITPTCIPTCNIISSYSPYYNIETEKRTQKNVKAVQILPKERSNNELLKDLARLLPKDSLKVLKKRKIYASRKNCAATEESDKKLGKYTTSKKRVSLEFQNISKEILSTITSRSKNPSKRSVTLDKPTESYSVISDPETISTHSQKASKQSLKSYSVGKKQYKRFSRSSTPRLSPKQSNPISCSGLKMGVMGILTQESPQNDSSSTDCLRSSVSKITFHKDADYSKKYSVHTAQSQQNNPVSSLLKLSNSQSLSKELFKPVTESNCEEIQMPENNDFSDAIELWQKTKEACKNIEGSFALNFEIIKAPKKDELNNSKTNINDSKKLNEIINNINDSFALKFNSVEEIINDKYKNTSTLISKENKEKGMIQQSCNLTKTNSKTVKEIKSYILLILNDEIKKAVIEHIYDSSNYKSVKVSSKDKSINSSRSKKQRINTPPKQKQVAAPKCSNNKILFSKTKMQSQKASAIRKTLGATSTSNMLSMDQNESYRSNKTSDCNASMETQREDVIDINSNEIITLKLTNPNSSTVKISDNHGTYRSLSEIKHEVYHPNDSVCNRNTLSVYTDNHTSETCDIKKISKDNLQSKSEKSIANIIEIDFKLKVINGDQSTKVHIGNDGHIPDKIHAKQASQDVLLLNEGEKKYSASEFITNNANGKNDINIKITIKNFKSQTKSGIGEKHHKTSKNCVDFSNRISEKFQMVAAPATSEIYSNHKATVNLTASRKSLESIKLNNNEGHHLSDIIMLSNENKSQSVTEMSDIKSATGTRKKKMSFFAKISNKTKERFVKSHGKLKCSESDTLASENHIGLENSIDVSSRTSNNSKSINSINRRDTGHTSNRKIDDDMIKSSEKFSSECDFQSQYKNQVKKELLKKVFQTANCLGKRKTKSRVRKLKSILKSILTSDSETDLSLVREDLIKDFTDVSLEKSSVTSLTSVLNTIDDSQKSYNKRKDLSSTDVASEKYLSSGVISLKDCVCATMADRLNKCGPFGTVNCCCSKPATKDEETSCNLAKEGQDQQITTTVSLVNAETQNSIKYFVSKLTNVSKHVYSNPQSITQVAFVDEESYDKIMRESFEPSTLNLKEVEISKETKITIKENESIMISSEVDNRQNTPILENKNYLEERKIEQINVTHKMKTASCRPSTDSTKNIISIDNFKNQCDRKTFIPKTNRVKPCEFKKLDRNTKLGISDNDKIIFLESESTKETQKHKYKHERKWEETNRRPLVKTDILQMYETKKAVLQIYAEKKKTVNGEKFVAELPVFVVNKESEIYRDYGDLVKYAYCSIRKNVI